MRSHVVIKNLSVNVAASDSSYMPEHVTVSAGRSIRSLREIKEVRIPRLETLLNLILISLIVEKIDLTSVNRLTAVPNIWFTELIMKFMEGFNYQN